MQMFGYKTWTMPLWGWGTGIAQVSGTLYLCPCWFEAGVIITRITVAYSTAATGVTLARFGIYRPSSWTLVASSGDVSASLAGGGNTLRDIPLTTPWTPTVSTAYWGGLLQVGTTPASLTNALPHGIGGLVTAAQQAGLSDLPAVFVPASTARANHFAAG